MNHLLRFIAILVLTVKRMFVAALVILAGLLVRMKIFQAIKLGEGV